MSSIEPKLNKNERRELAREKARQLREQQKRKDRRNKIFVRGGVITAVVAVVAVAALIVFNALGSVPSPSAGPLNMASSGIRFGQGITVTPTEAIAAKGKPVPHERAEGDVEIVLYLDYQCPGCRMFEAVNGEYIASLLENQGTTFEIRPIAVLDHQSQGARYSSRSANAAACVANFAPNQFYAFNTQLFDNQPAEGTTGLTDDELVALTVAAGVEEADSVASCIKDETFKFFVQESTDRARTGPLSSSEPKGIEFTPTVLVNGTRFPGGDQDAFKAFVVQAAGESFNEEEAEVPTPTPSATAAP